MSPQKAAELAEEILNPGSPFVTLKQKKRWMKEALVEAYEKGRADMIKELHELEIKAAKREQKYNSEH